MILCSRRLLTVCLVPSFFFLLSSCSDRADRASGESADTVEDPRASDLILITVDTLRADHMSLYGYARETTPSIDGFFAQGRVYERAYATSSYTPPSVVSILTGLWPFHHGIRRFMHIAPDSLETLATRLSAAGYDCGGFVSNYVLKDEKTGLARGFATYDDELPEKEPYRNAYERSAEPTTESVLAWLELRRASDRPYFLWVHYVDPHGPYAAPEPKAREFSHDAPEPMDIDAIPKYQRHPGLNDAAEYVDRYDEEIAHVDRSIGRLLRAITALDRDRPWLVAFTSDHGEALVERPLRFQHSHHVWEELILVPLALRGTGIATARVTEPVSIVDIAPTLLLAAGIQVPINLDGVPLEATPSRRTLYAESYPGRNEQSAFLWRAAIWGDEKWVLSPARGEPTNSFETNPSRRVLETLTPFPRAAVSPDALAVLHGWHKEDWSLQRNAKSGGPGTPGGRRAPKLTKEDRAALGALGYLE
jgi:arylsulfatase A-like enzyme